MVRRSQGGHLLSPEEGISVTEAIALYTRNAAYVTHEENTKGSITCGKLMDVIALDKNPTCIEPEELPQLRVRLTVVGGEVVWEG